MWSVLAIVSCGFAVAPARAEIAPEYYAQMQADAPESLTVKILRVQVIRRRTGDETQCHVSAVARVTDVERSRAGLRPSQRISIQYQTVERNYFMAGMAPVPVLKAGEETSAFLKRGRNRKAFSPAAQGYSFQKVDAEPLIELSPPG
jgi:hypothetical protein